jgi:hypothetical protein
MSWSPLLLAALVSLPACTGSYGEAQGSKYTDPAGWSVEVPEGWHTLHFDTSKVAWQPGRSHGKSQRSAPHLPRDGQGHHGKSSECSGRRGAGQTVFRLQRRRSGSPLDQTHNPSVAGSSPARPTEKSPGQRPCLDPVPSGLCRSAPHLPRTGHTEEGENCQL